MVPFRRSAVTAPLRGFVNETADVWEESEVNLIIYGHTDES